ncbi:MarR family winged helix-turn-helix transcriptional regulator [Dryocola sp. LX212]|jgi:DNA-binding MarR family transcriptional regulator
MTFLPAGYLITDVSRLARQIFFQRRTDNQLTQSQGRAIGLLSLNEGIRQVELAELMDLTPMSVMRVVDQLVERDLIERRQDCKDRRAFLLYLRPAAHQQLAQIKKESEALWREVLNTLEPEKIEVFVQALEEVRENLSAIKHRQN